MEGIELPVWAQIFIATLTAVITSVGGVLMYKKNVIQPSSNTSAVVTGIGAALTDRQIGSELTNAVYAIAYQIKHSTEELERLRKAVEAQTEKMLEEHKRLRDEAAEIRKHLLDGD